MATTIAAVPAGSVKTFRACVRCKLIKTFEQFSADGCDNCKDSLPKDRDQVHEYTTSQFDGMISMMRPSESWVAKWQRIEKKVAGVYAISVVSNNDDDDE